MFNEKVFRQRALTNQVIFSTCANAKERGYLRRLIKERREKYKQSGKYYNMLLKNHNRQKNNYDKKRVPYHLRKYQDFDDETFD